MALYLTLGAIGFSIATYTISRPGKDGEPSGLTKWIDGYRAASQQSWEQRNTLRTNIKDQAAADRHTFQTVEKAPGFELRMPEYVDRKTFHSFYFSISRNTNGVGCCLSNWLLTGENKTQTHRIR